MGESRRRRIAAAREAGRNFVVVPGGKLPPAPPQRYRRLLLNVPADVHDRLTAQLDAMEAARKTAGQSPSGLTLEDMAVSAIEAVLSRVEASAADAAQTQRLVHTATHIPAGMADAAARLRALKEPK